MRWKIQVNKHRWQTLSLALMWCYIKYFRIPLCYLSLGLLNGPFAGSFQQLEQTVIVLVCVCAPECLHVCAWKAKEISFDISVSLWPTVHTTDPVHQEGVSGDKSKNKSNEPSFK